MDSGLTLDTENNLVSRAQNGDHQAFNEIIRCHRAGVINIVFRMCGDSMLAEDAAQTAFIKAWQHLKRYKPHSSFRSWLYRIGINTALDMLRHQKRQAEWTHPSDIAELSLASNILDPEASLITEERRNVVQSAILSLPPASRAVLILREYQGLSYREISETLDIPTGTVMSRLNYARTNLATKLRPNQEVW